MRKIAGIVSVAALLVVTAPLAKAQNQPGENTPAQQDSHSDGTAPHGMGSTGWTGGTGGSHVGTSNQQTTGASSESNTPNNEAAADQPEMATGEDLNGPPTRFPANKTPE